MNSQMMLNKKEITRFSRLSEQFHACFPGGPVAFFGIAFHARANEIVHTASVPWEKVIHCHRTVKCTAVLTLVIVSLDNILTIQQNPFSGHFHKPAQPDDAGKFDAHIHGMDHLMILLNDFCLIQIKKNNSPARAAHAHGSRSTPSRSPPTPPKRGRARKWRSTTRSNTPRHPQNR